MSDEPDEAMSSIMLRWAQERANRMAQTKGAVAQIRKAMKEHGIAECSVRYAGSGDSGDGETCLYTMDDGTLRAPRHNAHWENREAPQLEVIVKDYRDVVSNWVGSNWVGKESKLVWMGKESKWVERERARDVELSDILCDIAMSYVSDRHGGWENNEGGFGEVTITETSVVVDHSDNIIETVNSVERYDDGEDGEDD